MRLAVGNVFNTCYQTFGNNLSKAQKYKIRLVSHFNESYVQFIFKTLST